MIWLLGIEALLFLAFGLYWACFSNKCTAVESEDQSEKRINDLEKQIHELNNKIAHLDGRFYGLSEYLREKLK